MFQNFFGAVQIPPIGLKSRMHSRVTRIRQVTGKKSPSSNDTRPMIVTHCRTLLGRESAGRLLSRLETCAWIRGALDKFSAAIGMMVFQIARSLVRTPDLTFVLPTRVGL